MAQTVSRLTRRTRGVAVAAQVGRNDAPAEARQRGELMAPGDAALGKAVQHKRDIVARAAFVAGEGDAVRLDAALDDWRIVAHRFTFPSSPDACSEAKCDPGSRGRMLVFCRPAWICSGPRSRFARPGM